MVLKAHFEFSNDVSPRMLVIIIWTTAPLHAAEYTTCSGAVVRILITNICGATSSLKSGATFSYHYLYLEFQKNSTYGIFFYLVTLKTQICIMYFTHSDKHPIMMLSNLAKNKKMKNYYGWQIWINLAMIRVEGGVILASERVSRGFV